VDPFSLIQPLLVVLVKLALLYALAQLYVVCLPEDSQHFVVHFPHALVGVLNQVQNAHEDLAFVEDAFEAHRVE
jgi:hypothetical protein